MAAVVVGLIALTTISVDGTYLRTLLPGLIIMGGGLGVAQVGIVGAAAAAASPAEQGAAAGLGTTSAQVGTAVGLALLVALAGRSGGADPEHLVAGYRAAFFGAAGFAGLAVTVAMVSSWRRRTRPEEMTGTGGNRLHGPE
jgi:MFS family permease